MGNTNNLYQESLQNIKIRFNSTLCKFGMQAIATELNSSVYWPEMFDNTVEHFKLVLVRFLTGNEKFRLHSKICCKIRRREIIKSKLSNDEP